MFGLFPPSLTRHDASQISQRLAFRFLREDWSEDWWSANMESILAQEFDRPELCDFKVTSEEALSIANQAYYWATVRSNDLNVHVRFFKAYHEFHEACGGSMTPSRTLTDYLQDAPHLKDFKTAPEID